MADIGAIRQQLNSIEDPSTRKALLSIFDYVLTNLRLGVPEHQHRAVNMQQYWLSSTTATDTGGFSVLHGLASAPRYAIPVLDLNRVGAATPVLETARVADDRRVYLKSPSTNVPVLLLVE